MGNCIWCGKKGLFLRVDQNNLCLPCQEIIYPDIKNKTTYLLYCYKRLKESKKYKVKLAHYELLIKTLEVLKKYEEKNIPTINIEIDLTDVFANVEGPFCEVTISDPNKEVREEFQKVLHEFGVRYGKLPESAMLIPEYKDALKYLYELMEKYRKEGILTLSEIEGCIKKRIPFRGVNSLGKQEDDSYKIFVKDTLIYDSGKNYFDCQFKRFSMYSEIQHMIATNIYEKDLALIRKEAKKEAGKARSSLAFPIKGTP